MATHDSQARTEPHSRESLTDSERDARIEQLLLAGLDEYFAGKYEHAISLWTRVLFLDRHHDRARAYIDRARSTQAERQREGEAMLQQGIDAFQQGDVHRARRLIAEALDRGAAREDAQGMLDRIERLGAGQIAPPNRGRASATAFRAPDVTPAPMAHGRRGWVAGVLLIVAALGVLAVGVLGITPLGWTTLTVVAPPAVTASSMPTPEDLPIPAANEAVLVRSRHLVATGRLQDALDQLDRIPVGDPLHSEANALRARIQRELLAIAAAEGPPVSQSVPTGRPPE